MIDERPAEDDAEPASVVPAEPEKAPPSAGALLGFEPPGEARETAERSPVLERLSALARRGFLLP